MWNWYEVKTYHSSEWSLCVYTTLTQRNHEKTTHFEDGIINDEEMVILRYTTCEIFHMEFGWPLRAFTNYIYLHTDICYDGCFHSGKRKASIWYPSVCQSVCLSRLSRYETQQSLTRRQHRTRPAYVSSFQSQHRHTWCYTEPSSLELRVYTEEDLRSINLSFSL